MRNPPYAPFCRAHRGHAEVTHHEQLSCDCPCHNNKTGGLWFLDWKQLNQSRAQTIR